MKRFFRSSPSLRRVLILPYVFLVFALSLGIGLLSYRAASGAVENVTNRLLQEALGRIDQSIERHIGGSKAVLEVAFPRGMPAPRDISAHLDVLRSRFDVATSLYPDPNSYVYYGNRMGQNFGLLRQSESTGQIRLKLNPAEHRQYLIFRDRTASLEPSSVEGTLFDPRKRPWYQLGQKSNEDVWIPAYLDFGAHDLVVTRARRVLSANGQFEGVVATDVSLKALNDYVQKLKPSQNGVAFVMETDGSLIASSTGSNLTESADGQILRQNVATSSDTMLRSTSAALKRYLAAGSASDDSKNTFTFDLPDGKTIHAAYDRIKDAAGLDWIVTVAIPRSDFISGVISTAALTGIAGIIAIIVSVLFGLMIVDWVVKDIAHLSEIAEKIGTGDLQAHISVDRQDEIGKLANSIGLMQSNLCTDKLTGLASRAVLARYVQSEIEKCRTATSPSTGFAVLFIDLDGFKQINDKYGHQIGDLTLIEIARRLQGAVRQGDIVARYGGDEFVIVLRQIENIEIIKKVSADLKLCLLLPLICLKDFEQISHRRGASIGVALYPEDGEDAETLIKNADQKMYEEKRRGMNPEKMIGKRLS